MLEISNIYCSFVVMGNITPYRRLFVEPEKYEIVKFVDNGFELEVNVSPAEETVWLTQDQMADLFQKTWDCPFSASTKPLKPSLKF